METVPQKRDVFGILLTFSGRVFTIFQLLPRLLKDACKLEWKVIKA